MYSVTSRHSSRTQAFHTYAFDCLSLLALGHERHRHRSLVAHRSSMNRNDPRRAWAFRQTRATPGRHDHLDHHRDRRRRRLAHDMYVGRSTGVSRQPSRVEWVRDKADIDNDGILDPDETWSWRREQRAIVVERQGLGGCLRPRPHRPPRQRHHLSIRPRSRRTSNRRRSPERVGIDADGEPGRHDHLDHHRRRRHGRVRRSVSGISAAPPRRVVRDEGGDIDNDGILDPTTWSWQITNSVQSWWTTRSRG